MDTNRSRRSFLKASAVVGATYATHIVGSPTFASSLQSSVIVVGAGAFGGWSALHLLQRGAKVTLLDAWGPGNSRASSGGETRTIRATYGPAHILYIKMVARALQLWQEYERRWNLKLFFRSGALRMRANDSYESAALPVLKESEIRFEKLSAADCASRWPQINFDGVPWSIYEPDSGFLAARRGCEAVLDAFLKQGGQYSQAHATPGRITANHMEGITVGQGEALTADTYVFAPGPWLGRVFPFLSSSIAPTRQEVFFFGAPAGDLRFTEEHLPTWIDGGVILFSAYLETTGAASRSLTIRADRLLIPAPWSARSRRRNCSPRVRTCACAFRQWLVRRCLKAEFATDHNFILDRHPEAVNLWIVGGGSGHGFKHGPVMGEMVADAVLGSKAPPAEMGLARLLRIAPK